ncbi:probable disease resistance protein At4g27220 isoform X1 [Durio zibethinus]|uniref:Probable disease resistance protein At4g27220 isoform X1 n=1 Tax=Durio zibethinus TaxID=66656 RepID=A0A6P5ZKW9_DURZI|nr:probable disease resistance protein At4g27220 isoform X1 [Durio zibethinus]XP_022753192.1 probable disease resistance protein At4g27220 isoform X1 [Durio zibethinus]XP_022753193.1 probable disease resistance protein At4g27220 isoform X1 [Durio zibethinus]
MEFVEPILEAIKCLGYPTSRYIDHHRKLEENMNDLRRRVAEVNTRKQDLELRKEAEIRCRKVVKKEVENWFEDVLRVNTEMEKIETKFRVVSYFSRARLGKLVCQKIEEVDRIYQKGSFPEGVAVEGPPPIGVTLPTTNLEGEMDVKEQIWEYLMGDEVGMIGVGGMGGIGKTAIMKHINNQLLKQKLFDAVIWVTVSREFNAEKLQGDIACALDYCLPKNKLEWPTVLMEILETKRYVLILDDVWEQFSLLDVGIPEPTLHNGSKLIITSRLIEVCNSMGCKVLKVQPLSLMASLKLFLHQVGDGILQDPALKEIVTLIVEQCGGLPLAIVTIGSSMKGVNDTCEWKNALNELNERVKSVKGLDTKIFEHLKFSYDRLKDSKIQNCFLYCSLYPEDYHIEKEELIEKWIDEELIDELETRQAMHDRGHSILNKLVNNCLLEGVMIDGVKLKEGVKMHDVVRDMALSIKIGCDQFMVKAGVQLEEIPTEHKWKENLEKVSLMDNLISKVSQISPKCHNLSTLFLQKNHILGEISESLFDHMNGLKVLDLSHTIILDLPNSISNLENLVSLRLRHCFNLRYVCSLAKLKALRKLDLFNTAIKEVPHGIEMLTNLTYLDLYSRHLKELPIGILSSFPNLQYSKTWLNIKGEEVAKPRKLEILLGLFCEVQDLEGYAKSLSGQGPTKYWLGVGSPKFGYFDNHTWFRDVEDVEVDKEVCFINCEIGNEDLVLLPNDVRTLTVQHCQNLKNLSNVSLFHEANALKTCTISWCEGIECVVDLALSSCNSLQNIEVLSLRDLLNLLELVRGVAVVSTSNTPTLPAIFSSLKKMHLIGCSSIKKLFPVQLLQGFQNLEYIEISRCEKLEKIIAEEEEENQKVEERGPKTTVFILPKLQTLHLINLPELKSICGSGVMIPAESLQYLSIINCSKLKKIPFSIPLLETGQPSRPPLEYGYVHPREWWKSVEFDDPNAKDVLSPIVLDSLEEAED